MQLNSTEISELDRQRIAQLNVVSEAHNEGVLLFLSVTVLSAFTARRLRAQGETSSCRVTVTLSH